MSVIFSQIHLHATTSPAKPAIMLSDRVASFSMIASGMESARTVLDGFSLDREKPVGVLIDNPARHIILSLALIKSGFAKASLRRDLLKPALEQGVTTILTDERLPPLEGIRSILVDERWFTETRTKEVPAQPIAPDRIINLAFTSGSTGRPKLMASTHGVIVERVNAMAMTGLGGGERVMSAYGVSGPGFAQSISTLMSGRTTCFSSPVDLLSSMIFCGADSFRGSVGHLRTLLAAQEEFGRPLKLKRVSVGGALLSFDMAEKVRASFGCDIVNSYASVESGLIGCASGALLARRGALGNCYVPLAEVKICNNDGLDCDDSQCLPPGSEGVIYVRSDRASQPYTGSLNLCADSTDGKWIKTGDMGLVTQDNLLVVTGRADEVINMGGAKFDPEVVEGMLMQHPEITGAAVLRMIGEDGGHEAWAFIQPGWGLDVEALNDWLWGRNGGAMLSLNFSRVTAIDTIPKTASGKVDRGALRKRFARQP